jgi:ADP-ribosylation factor-like protein 8
MCFGGGCIVCMHRLFMLLNRFVIDAADHARLGEAKDELHALLKRPQLVDIPVLVLGNKNDLEGALTEAEMIEAM